MRILSIGNFGLGWDGSICDEEHIAKALEGLGHEVIRQPRNEFTQLSPSPLNSFDFILIAQWDGYVHDKGLGRFEDGLGRIHEFGCPVVYWAFDYQADGQEWHERLIQGADLYLSKRIADSKYPNWQWLSQDFAPEFLDKTPTPPPGQDIEVLFTGSYLPWAAIRNETIRAVAEKFKLVIHSVNSWPEEWKLDVRSPVMDEGLPELYARAKVILSIDHTIEAGYWSDRSAQIIACGRRPLFRYVPLSEIRFGGRVDYFYNTADCLQQIEEQLTSSISNNEFRTEGLYVKDRVQDLLTIVKGIL